MAGQVRNNKQGENYCFRKIARFFFSGSGFEPTTLCSLGECSSYQHELATRATWLVGVRIYNTTQHNTTHGKPQTTVTNSGDRSHHTGLLRTHIRTILSSICEINEMCSIRIVKLDKTQTQSFVHIIILQQAAGKVMVLPHIY